MGLGDGSGDGNDQYADDKYGEDTSGGDEHADDKRCVDKSGGAAYADHKRADHKHRIKRYVVLPLALLLVLAGVLGVATGAFSSAARAGLTATGLLSDGGASTLPPGALQSPSLNATPSGSPTAPVPSPSPSPDQLPDVLSVATPLRSPVKARLTRALEAIDRSDVKGSFSGSVIDAGTGQALYAKNSAKGYIPASTLKVVTSTAALSILGPQHRFSTRVVAGGAGRIVLVGGGDPYLVSAPTATHPGAASVSRLAQLTANQLKKNGQRSVSLGYDATLFSGPSWHPDWPRMYADQVTPISALWVDEGRLSGSTGPRVTKPAQVAAETFARALRKDGIRVTAVRAAKANRRAKALASVASLPLERVIERLLMVSDNDASEVLFRQAAVGAGQPGTFADGRRVVQARLTKLGLWHPAARLRDGSGLSRKNKIPAAMLTVLLRAALSAERPELRGAVTGLPVAGVEGSLRIRYFDKVGRPVRGLVRGKTGALTGVHSLAGYVRRPDGSLLAYAFLVNNTPDGQAARLWLEHVTATLTSCRCR